MRRPNFDFVQELMVTIADRMRAPSGDVSDGDFPAAERVKRSCERLMSKSGEASQVAIATDALNAYSELEVAEQVAFFRLLLNDYSVDPDRVRQAYLAWDKEPGDVALTTLFNAVEPGRQTLLRRLNLSSGGTSALVQMRKDLLEAIKSDPDLKPVDADFSHLFASWFNRGFLVMRRIDWDTPASILDKIVEYEAVHEIRDWDDLRRRLDPADRRCYGFFHPSTGDEPLIFVEVALCKGVPRKIGPLLSVDTDNPVGGFDTAVFYSISNCQKGLTGVSFGNFLIKQVVQELHHELPDLDRFVTLSPMPGLAKWIDKAANENAEIAGVVEQLRSGEWQQDESTRAALEPTLKSLSADYLHAKSSSSGGPIDPVARFHLGNGACVHSLNWPADTSQNGIENSYSAMVNYLYEPDKIDDRHEKFVDEGKIALGEELQRSLKKLGVEAA